MKKLARTRSSGARVPAKDKSAGAKRGKEDRSPTTVAGADLIFPVVEFWPEPVWGCQLLDELVATFTQYIAVSGPALVALALWVVHTHLIDVAEMTPRLAVLSPLRRCGKTRLLELLSQLVHRALTADNVTAAVVFRTVHEYQPTLLIDEADTFLGEAEALRGVLNSGHRREGKIFRCVGDQHAPRIFRTYAPVVIAAIGELPDTIMDRAVVIRMRRRLHHEIVAPLRRQERTGLFALQRKIVRWASEIETELKEPQPIPELDDRANDNWEPLFAIADCAGGDWPKRARAAAIDLSRERNDVEQAGSLHEQLLEDIRGYFARTENDDVGTAVLLEELRRLEGRPWAEASHGRPLTGNHLGRLLKRYGIRPGNMRRGQEVLKGYDRADFNDAFARYLPARAATSATARDDAAPQDVADVADVADDDPFIQPTTWVLPKKRRVR